MTTLTEEERTATGRLRCGALMVVCCVLASGVATQLIGDATARIAVGAVVTGALAGLARAEPFAAVRGPVVVLAALSVLNWAPATLLAVPPIGRWVDGAPVALAFLVVNALKLTAVAPLLLVARRLGWTRGGLLLRRGHPNARSFVPGLRWTLLAPIVVLAVEALFVTTTPGVDPGRLGVLAPLLPVMLLGAVVNAACEELLYRHALVTRLRTTVGTASAVLLSSAVFGLGHLAGTPGGMSGVLFTFAYGAVCAVAMLQTRGACWNVVIHVGGDLSAVTTLVLAA